VQVKVIQNHPGEGQFPAFVKGTPVLLTGSECEEFRHWFPCEIERHNTYIPESFIANDTLVRNYNPTELVVRIGDILEVCEIVNAWLLAKDQNGQVGWIPAEAVVSV